VSSGGILTATEANISGAITASTITGSTINSTSTLNGVTGTFSGTLTADAINAVNTINLAGQAVTIPVSVYTSGPFSYVSGSYVVVQTASITSSGAPILVLANLLFMGDVNNNGGSMRILRNGVSIYEGGVRSTYETGGTLTGVVTDTPGAGGHTYKIEVRATNGMLFPSNISLALLETKR
jgi:hypothetical protein